MKIVNKSELNSIMPSSDMFSNKNGLYTCIFNDKIFLYKEIMNFSEEQINTLETVSTIKDKNLIFPEFLVYDKNKFSGYVTKYLNGYSPICDSDDLNLNERIKMLKKARKIILNMHKNNLIHMDLNPFNILYKRSKIKIIDFDDSIYKSNKTPTNLNKLVLEYLSKNDLDYSVDVFMFNITTISLLFDISFYDVFEDCTEEKLTDEKKEVFEKTKKLQKLNNNDFLIDYYD